MANKPHLKITSDKFLDKMANNYYHTDKVIENILASNKTLDNIYYPDPEPFIPPEKPKKVKLTLAKPPVGYRPLKVGEIIGNKDLYYFYSWKYGDTKWRPAEKTSFNVGNKYSQMLKNGGASYARKIDRIKYTKEQRESAVIYLKKSRAFNEDSAIAVKSNFILYFSLARNKVIGMVDESRFFYKTKKT